MERIQIHAVVRGVVQGVGYRRWLQMEAEAAGLTGWVKNLADGSVECVVQGERPGVEAVLDRLWEGPRGAAVEEVDSTVESPVEIFSEFTITR